MPDETRRELDELRAYLKQLRDEVQQALDEAARISGSPGRQLSRLSNRRP